MGTGLYDAVFATLGKLHGKEARAPITNLTLFGGFSSTVCWPLSAYLAETFGWRSACLVYAALHLVVALPLQLAVMPPLRKSDAGRSDPDTAAARGSAAPVGRDTAMLALIAAVLAISSGIGSIVIVHLMIFLQARGIDLVAAVTLGTLFGPAQVGARIVERLFGQHYHPIWTMVASCAAMFLGLVMLLSSFPLTALTILIYGGGYGIMWIARGTLPLSLFGPGRYATLMGRLAFPSLIVQALAPSAAAAMIERLGAESTMAALAAAAGLNLDLIGLLWWLCRRLPP
jgi:hypothetical protein